MKTLKGMTWDHPRAYDCLIAASRAYEKETGVALAWDKRSLQDFADAPIQELATDYDLIILDHPHVGQIAQTGCLAPLSPDVSAAQSIGGSFESYQWNGSQWAYPVDAACQMAVRRPDISAPFPTHWEDITGPDAPAYKLLTPLLPVDAFDMMMTLVAGRGETVLAATSSEFCTEANGLWALGLLKVLYKLGPADAVAMNPIHVLEALSTSDDFAASPCLFGYINYARPGFRPHQLRYADLPLAKGHTTRCGILGGAGIGVSALRASASEAQKFATWVTSGTPQSAVYLENDGQPAHRAPWENLRQDPRYSNFFDSAYITMNTAWTRPRDEWFLDFVDEVCAIFSDFLTRDQPNDGFLDTLNALYRHHIGETP